MGLRVQGAGVGLLLDKNTVTAGELQHAIARVAGDDAFRRPIPELQASFRAAGGVARAADLIEQAAAS
jgi:UDP:flavonoid glycosyltransferase YjiC (YdhE family)